MKMHGYEYRPITASPRTFRVIRLLPTQKPLVPWGLSRPTLRIQIVEVDVDADYPYDALSYSWNVSGLQAPDRRVIVETPDGPRELYIFEPLETALLHLAANKATVRPLFVDQICINQSSHPEKVVQVQLMRDIYAKCVRTLVWLGPGTNASDKYFDLVQSVCELGVLGRLMGPHVDSFPTVFSAVMDPDLAVNDVERQDRDDVLSMLSRYGHQFPIDGAVDVLQRTWFTRLWIIQEACLAPTVAFVCGTRSLCFDCFRAGSLFFSIYNTHWIANVKHDVSKDELRRRDRVYALMKSLIRIYQERKGIHTSGRRQNLYDLVLKYNVNDGQPKIGATLPEDRLYGVFGMAEDLGPFNKVRIRYRDTAKVYTEFAGMLVSHSIDILVFSQFPKLIDGLPSWVPDWSMDLSLPHGYAALNEPLFAAGGPIRDEVPWVDHYSSCLTVQGLVVGRIAQVGQHAVVREADGAILEQIDYRSLKRLFDEINEFLDLIESDSSTLRPSVLEEAERALTIMRLSDRGLSAKHFSSTIGATAASELLQSFYVQASKWGQRLIDTEKHVQSYGLTRIFKTVGIMPWYWTPASEMDVLRLCASKPMAACQTLMQGVAEFTIDMIGLCLASTTVQLYARYIRIRRRFARLNFRAVNRNQVLDRVGLNPDISASTAMKTYAENVYRNIGQHIYRTTQGHMGMVPKRAQKGDFIVVLFGGTVPHVVRPVGSSESDYEYIGEAYCDGVMDGELFEHGEVEAETFQLVR